MPRPTALVSLCLLPCHCPCAPGACPVPLSARRHRAGLHQQGAAARSSPSWTFLGSKALHSIRTQNRFSNHSRTQRTEALFPLPAATLETWGWRCLTVPTEGEGPWCSLLRSGVRTRSAGSRAVCPSEATAHWEINRRQRPVPAKSRPLGMYTGAKDFEAAPPALTATMVEP